MNPWTECRRHVRVRPQASEVSFEVPRAPGPLPLVDFSADGALVRGKPVRPVGRHVRFSLLFPACQPMVVDGRVVRSSSNGNGGDPGFAVDFERVPVKTMRLLTDTVTHELKRQLRRVQPAALVVDGSKTICRFVRDTLSDFGVTAHAESAVLNAINWLVRGEQHARTIFVGNPVGSGNAFELAQFVSSHLPEVRVVLLVEQASRSEPSPPIRSAGPAVTLLGKPWTPARLASFLL